MEIGVFNGLPAHPLLVHAVVVLVPLAAFLLVLSVAWPAARRRLGVMTPLVALAALALVPLTTNAGEWLERRLGGSPVIDTHTEQGELVIYWAAALFALSLAWWLLHTPLLAARLPWADTTPRPGWVRVVAAVLAAASVFVAVGSMVQIYRAGDSGARAVWQGVVREGD